MTINTKDKINATEVETDVEKKTRLRKVAIATIVGTMLEWYDFYLYAAMASIVLAKVFFDTSNPQLAVLQSFGTFAIGFIARPIGGMFFGYLGDRHGRKLMLMLTFCLMGFSTAVIGLIPGYATIGFWAPMALIFLRILQGMAAGAEVAASVTVSYEHASADKRGSQGAWPALGLNLGLLLSSLTIYLLTLKGEDFLLAGGWRIPFILSIGLVFVGIWVRKSVPETPDFANIQANQPDKPQILDVFRQAPRSLLVVLFVALGYASLSYTFKTFSLAYLTQTLEVSAQVTSLAITIASIVGIFSIIFFGWLCDKWSSKNVLATAAALSATFAYPFMLLLATKNNYMIYIALGVATGILTPMMFSAQGAFLSRQFPVLIRSTGIAAARETGSAIAGSVVPLAALTMVTLSPTNSIAGVVCLLIGAGAITVVATLFDQGKHYTIHKN